MGTYSKQSVQRVKEETEKGREEEKIDVTKQRDGKRGRKDARTIQRWQERKKKNNSKRCVKVMASVCLSVCVCVV